MYCIRRSFSQATKGRNVKKNTHLLKDVVFVIWNIQTKSAEPMCVQALLQMLHIIEITRTA